MSNTQHEHDQAPIFDRNDHSRREFALGDTLLIDPKHIAPDDVMHRTLRDGRLYGYGVYVAPDEDGTHLIVVYENHERLEPPHSSRNYPSAALTRVCCHECGRSAHVHLYDDRKDAGKRDVCEACYEHDPLFGTPLVKHPHVERFNPDDEYEMIVRTCDNCEDEYVTHYSITGFGLLRCEACANPAWIRHPSICAGCGQPTRVVGMRVESCTECDYMAVLP